MPITVPCDDMEAEEEEKVELSEWPLLLPSALVAHLCIAALFSFVSIYVYMLPL